MTVHDLEETIYEVEGFRVRLRHRNGRDVRGDRKVPRPYPFVRMRKPCTTVGEWIAARLAAYSDYAVEVLDGRGRRVRRNTHLHTVRQSYR
jgi:hypothetical protein